MERERGERSATLRAVDERGAGARWVDGAAERGGRERSAPGRAWLLSTIRSGVGILLVGCASAATPVSPASVASPSEPSAAAGGSATRAPQEPPTPEPSGQTAATTSETLPKVEHAATERPPDASAGDESAPEPTPRCPEEMALVRRPQGPYCIDRWEATLMLVEGDGERRWPGNRFPDAVEHRVRAVSEPGQKPQGYISGEQAGWACERAGKRLCEIDEWVRACRGPRLTTYPYGDERQPNQCNDRYKIIDRHPVVRLYRKEEGRDADPQGMWHPRWMNDPRLHEYDHTVTPTGERRECTNELGVFDMVGNLHEWVADPEGTFFGGFFMDTYQNGEGCEYRTVFHPIGYHDYSTGFRCCADPEWERGLRN